MQLFKIFQNDQSDVEKVIHYNKLKELVLSSRYTEAISYISIYQKFVYVKDLYEIALIYGGQPAFMYYTNYFITQDIGMSGGGGAGGTGGGGPYFTRMISRYPLHSMLLKSVVNMVNVEYFEALFDYFPDSRPTLGDLIKILERGNVDLLRLYAVKVDHLATDRVIVEDDHETPYLDIKRFVYSLKYECDTEYVHKVSEVVRMIPSLREMIVDQLMDSVAHSIISKEYFLESLFKSILDSDFEFENKDQYISKNYSFVRSNSSTNSLHDLI